MEPVAAILTDIEPRHVLELGHDRTGRAWSAGPAWPDAHIIHMAERERWAEAPERLGTELTSLEVPLDLVIEHTTDDAAMTLGVFEVVFGRLPPGGVYVIDGVLPSAVVLELMFASVVSPDVVDSLTLTPGALMMARGPRDASAERLRMGELTSDPFGLIA